MTPRSPRSRWRTRRKKRSSPPCRRPTASPPPHGGTGLRFRHQTDRGHGVASTLARHQRHHDGRDVRGLSDGDSGAAGVSEIPSSHRYEEGELRVITIGPTFAGLVAESFDQIRGSAIRQCRHHVADAWRAANHRQSDGQSKPTAGASRTSAMDRRIGRTHHRVPARPGAV